jgi:hypothetical protein
VAVSTSDGAAQVTSVDKAIDQELLAAIDRHSSLTEAIEILKKYRDAGVTADRVYDFLNVKLEEYKEFPEHDDFIREIMDIVIGYCSPHLVVWD